MEYGELGGDSTVCYTAVSGPFIYMQSVCWSVTSLMDWLHVA